MHRRRKGKFFTFTITFFFVFLMPWKLGQQEWVEVELALQPEYQAGTALLIPFPPSDQGVQSLQLQGRSLLRLDDKQTWFGVIGLYGGGQTLLHGRVDQGRPGFSTYFRRSLKVLVRPLGEARRLNVPPEVWARVDDRHEEQKRLEREIMQEVLRGDQWGPLMRGCWKRPVNSIMTSPFGSPRSLPDGRRYYHVGVDLRARTGTPIYSPGPGVVAWAGHMIVPGNVVVLAHGDGLFSRYMHLSRIDVEMGQKVSTGDQLGLAGATGRVTAPHLHWEVLWRENHADPLQFLQVWEQICHPK